VCVSQTILLEFVYSQYTAYQGSMVHIELYQLECIYSPHIYRNDCQAMLAGFI